MSSNTEKKDELSKEQDVVDANCVWVCLVFSGAFIIFCTLKYVCSSIRAG